MCSSLRRTLLHSSHAAGPDRSRGRARARRFVDRHARASRRASGVRRRHRHRRLGADVFQPHARARCAAGRLRCPKSTARSLRHGHPGLRGSLPRLRACAVLRSPGRRAHRAGGRRRVARHGSARPPRPRPTEAAVEAVRLWVAAGIFGAALGPALGGSSPRCWAGSRSFSCRFHSRSSLSLLSEGCRSRRRGAAAGRPALSANAAVLLLSGGLVAALFLLVLLLVEGWGMSPAAAGLVVTVMPLAALLAARLAPRSGRLRLDRGGHRPRRRRAGGARLSSAGRLALDDRPAAPGRSGHRARPRGADRTSRGCTRGTGRSRRLDVGRAPRRGRPRAAPAHTGADRSARSQRGARGACRRGGGPRQQHPGSRQAAARAGRPGRSPPGRRGG